MKRKNDLQYYIFEKVYIFVAICCIGLFFAYTIKWAWCSDDAYHAYVMSKNFLDGYGFTPTVGKRVNVSTCPLWTIVVTFFLWIFKDEYYVGIVLNLLFSWISFVILMFVIYRGNTLSTMNSTVIGRDTLKNETSIGVFVKKTILSILVTCIVCLSKSFVSYTTSGLENSQLYLLTTIFLVYYFAVCEKNKRLSDRQIFVLALIEGAIIFTRMDAGLLFLPLCIFAGINCFSDTIKEYIFRCLKRLCMAVLGILPFIIWEFFSVFYYGSFVPNTALAKLNTGFPKQQYYERGIAYYFVSFEWDCLVILLPVLFVFISFFVFLKNRVSIRYIHWPLLGIGILLYMLYIVSIGGDFMKGRHFTVIFWVALVSISYLLLYVVNEEIKINVVVMTMMLIATTYALMIKGKVIDNPMKYCTENIKWVYTDEREVYFPYTGLRNVFTNGKDLIWECQHKGIKWYHGENWYEEILYDPLLSRLPADSNNNEWMVGHMTRDFPDGYQETLETGINCIENHSLHEYYDHILTIISGDLFSTERIKEIINLNFGKYDYLINDYLHAN